jgi:NADH dehydrogenase
VLSSFSERSQRRALRQLERLGVEIRHRSRVVGVEENALIVSTEHGTAERIPASTVLWAAGVRGSALSTTLGVPLDRSGRVIVDASLTLPGYDEVFCIGDMAACTDAGGRSVPGIAPAAMQQGRYVAERIAAGSQRGTPGFRYRNKGQLATIGRSAAVAEFGWLALSGFVAWVLWLVVHLCFLVGFRNRYLVLSQWVWHYVTFQGGARLITGPREGEITWPAQPRRLARPPALSLRPGDGE